MAHAEVPACIGKYISSPEDIAAITNFAEQFRSALTNKNPSATSALDVNCNAHELDNLYVVDASFFVSCGAVNPSLTIIANALRVADRLRARMPGGAT